MAFCLIVSLSLWAVYSCWWFSVLTFLVQLYFIFLDMIRYDKLFSYIIITRLVQCSSKFVSYVSNFNWPRH